MENIDMWRHPKYYKELRKLRNRVVQSSRTASPQSDQAISDSTATAKDSVRPGPGPKPQAPSTKPQAPSDSNSRPQASSDKQQASSSKPQAASSKLQDLRTTEKFHGARTEGLDSGARWFTIGALNRMTKFLGLLARWSFIHASRVGSQ